MAAVGRLSNRCSYPQVLFYELDRLDFAEAYLVASAERTGVDAIASFDRSIDRVATITSIEPGRA
jgi:predicted nucleic acid-binding protein